MKLEVGMYVRYKRGGMGYIDPADKIGKIINQVNDSDIYELDNNNCIFENDVVNASFNIIDLIEEEDYANGVKVKYIYEKGEKYGFNSNYVVQEKSIELDGSYEYDTIPSDFLLKNKDIKSVVTKEQMEQMAYKVGE